MFAFILLLAAAFAAGVINSVAGGGSFLTFPALVFARVPAVMANASNTVALVPISIASAAGYRRDIQRLHQGNLRSWFLICLAGGAVGAWLLLITSDRLFRQIAPWLLLFATLLFAFGAQVSTMLGGRLHSNRIAMLFLLFPIAVYGGYFGGGVGIMILAIFRLYGMTDIHGMNGIKTILSALLNGIASIIFIVAHQIVWPLTLAMIVAGSIGGYLGPFIARRLKPSVIRITVITVGILMTAWFFHIAPH